MRMDDAQRIESRKQLAFYVCFTIGGLLILFFLFVLLLHRA